MKIRSTTLLEDLIKVCNNCAEISRDTSMRQKTLKETRYYEGQTNAFRYIRDFLKDLEGKEY